MTCRISMVFAAIPQKQFMISNQLLQLLRISCRFLEQIMWFLDRFLSITTGKIGEQACVENVKKIIIAGFIGKTAIQPKADSVLINDALKVFKEDYDDAKEI